MSVSEDVLVEILKRLPVRSLVKFRCVSKAWLRLISSPAFVCNHTLFTITRTERANLLLIGHPLRGGGGRQETFTLRFDDDQSFAECRDLGTPLLYPHLQFNGFCHGLLCLSCITYDRSLPEKKTVIWNPTLGISVTLPEPSLKTSRYWTIGFGFDSKRNDYKVIRIPFEGDNSRYELFELSQNAWRVVTPRVRPPSIYALTCRVSFNGWAHWVGCGSSEPTIVAYSFSDEVFRELRLPFAVNDVDLIFVKETRYLSVTHSSIESDPLVFHTYIWVMKEYGVEKSWTKLFNVHPPELLGCPRLFGFRTNGELLAGIKDDELVSFDSSTNAVTLLGYTDARSPINFVGDHIETLALLQVPGGERRLYKKREDSAWLKPTRTRRH